MIQYIKEHSSYLKDDSVSPIRGGKSLALELLDQIDPKIYGATRNYLEGFVTHLSPYIRHGIISLSQVKETALKKVEKKHEAEKLIQELTWRWFWQRLYWRHPEWIWRDVEPYKTGYSKENYYAVLPKDIEFGHTGVACIDTFIEILINTGYLHNHARLYLAAYVVHFRKVCWQAGAKWFLCHLIDGDPASNNFSWQWVASTFSGKPYFFNLENVRKYAGHTVDTSISKNKCLHGSYQELELKLFRRQ
ncbi:MAG: FAD-binding domain-containing protein [Chlamydiota bacterium]